VARANVENCPVCGRSLPDFGGWPAWCAECGWGLDPAETSPPVPASGFAAWWQRRTAKAEQAELQRLLADPALLSRPHPRRLAIYAAAVAVHVVTLALLTVGAWVMTTGVVGVLKVFAGVVAFGLVAITFPVHRLRPSTAASPPATLAAAATVANGVGAAAPRRVHVTSYGSPAPAPVSRRVLTVDADRWQTLGSAGRVALLAHQIAHRSGHDPRRTMLVTLASETLDGWLALLRPDPRARRRRKRRLRGPAGETVAAPPPNRLIGLSELILPIAIAPVYGGVLAFGWVLREGGTVAGLRAELYADALAARTGGAHGVAAATDLIDGELAELAAGGNRATPLADLPAPERERRRRTAVATGSRIDAMHPTFAARLQMLAVLPVPQQSVYVNDADLAVATGEIAALAAPNE